MSSLRNLKGQRFGRLAVLRRIRILKRKAYPAQWHCLCDCGNNRIITSSSLVRGLSQSCGCLRSELSSARAVKNLSRTYPRLIHGHARKRDKSRTYSTWLAMIQRCYYPKNVGYKNYGARGITVCNRWRKSFEAFLEDMGERPALERLSIAGPIQLATMNPATPAGRHPKSRLTIAVSNSRMANRYIVSLWCATVDRTDNGETQNAAHRFPLDPQVPHLRFWHRLCHRALMTPEAIALLAVASFTLGMYATYYLLKVL